jgi:hypothetical protein
MNRILRGFITIEKSLQVIALLGVVALLIYIGFSRAESDRPQGEPQSTGNVLGQSVRS